MINWDYARKDLRDDTTNFFNKHNNIVDVLFLGDSITESLTGKSLNMPCCAEQREAFSNAWDEKNVVKANGISGDQTQHLLWRLIVGNEFGNEDVKVKKIVINIGTNNLGSGMTPAAAAEGVVRVVEVVCDIFSAAEVYVEAIFPRSRLQKQVAETNVLLKKMMDDRKDSWDAKRRIVKMSNCGELLRDIRGGETKESDWKVNIELMPDSLHPNGEGVSRWMECIKTTVKM
jgi:lysophospholipase L1-like esterase